MAKKFLKSKTHCLNLSISTLNEISVGFPLSSISVLSTFKLVPVTSQLVWEDSKIDENTKQDLTEFKI